MQKSEWDGLLLPERWNRIAPYSKGLIIAYLQHRHNDPVPCWQNMGIRDRRAVVLHLCAVGSVDAIKHERVRMTAGKSALMATHRAQLERAMVMGNNVLKNLPFTKNVENSAFGSARTRPLCDKLHNLVTSWERADMLYPQPNGGKRILPSVYTKLTDRWLRANGIYNEPSKMNQGHLKNCVNLLNESHVNLVDRMATLLGKMHGHLGNRPDLQEKLVDLFHDFEVLQVDELYPIVEVLASYIQLTANDVDFDPHHLDS